MEALQDAPAAALADVEAWQAREAHRGIRPGRRRPRCSGWPEEL
ncbi:hypothetical protein ACRAWF_27295 [Streptomyces sp. L7]